VIGHKSIRVAENLYCYVWQGRGNNCNTSLFCRVLRGERPHVVVDPGHIRNEFNEACFDSLSRAMEKDGFRVEEVGLVISTHSHPDHFQASELMVRRSGALVTLSQAEYEFYCTGGMGREFYRALGLEMPQATPSFYLEVGDLSLGSKDKVNLKVLSTPGHSPGSISLYWPEKKILISGDVVFFASIGRTDFPGGSPYVLRKSIEMLSQLDVECLIPGHSTEPGKILAGKQKVERNFNMVKLFI